MALVTQLAALDLKKRPELSLSEQAYYDQYVRPQVEREYAETVGAAGAARRGAMKSQGQIVSAQLGGQQTSLGESAVGSMAPTFRRAMRHSLAGAQKRAGEIEAQGMLEREQKRAKALGALGTVTSLESAAASIIPDAGPVIAGGTALAGVGFQEALKAPGKSRGPVRTYQHDAGYGDSDMSASMGGGGLYDLYNLTYG